MTTLSMQIFTWIERNSQWLSRVLPASSQNDQNKQNAMAQRGPIWAGHMQTEAVDVKDLEYSSTPVTPPFIL